MLYSIYLRSLFGEEEMLKKIKFKGGFFSEETELELFLRADRMSLIYGKNGSGKSTISKAIRKAKGRY